MDNTYYGRFSGIEYEEMVLLEEATKNMTVDEKQKFFMIYQGRRQDANSMLIFILLGFLGIAGVHRFVIGDIALGILYLLTAGLCWIGTIVDLVNYKTITLNYNRQKIQETLYFMQLNR